MRAFSTLFGCAVSAMFAALLSIFIVPTSFAAGAPAANHLSEAEHSRALGIFLDQNGHLALPPGFTGSLNPAGYALVSGNGEAPRFAPLITKGVVDPADARWTAGFELDDGCNGPVNALAVGAAGELYVGGAFTLCGDVAVSNIARFDPGTGNWSVLGSSGGNGVNGAVNALAVSGGDLYVGGIFQEVNVGAGVTANRIARWNGSAWSAVGSAGGNGVDNAVRALAVSGSDLYVGGDFTSVNLGSPLSANRIAMWNGSAWSALGSGGNGLDNQVYALAVSGPDLYVGGLFTQANVGAPIAANRVARWSGGVWSALGSAGGNGVDGQVRALAVSGSDLFVGGSLTQANLGVPVAANRIARWNGSSWSTVGSGAGNGVNSSVLSMAVVGADLYVGGAFFQANVGDPIGAIRLARWNGSAWSSVGTGNGNGASSSVLAMAVSGSDLYVGGFMTLVNTGESVPASRIARWSGSAWSAVGNSGGLGTDNQVNALAVSGSDVYVGGSFTSVGGLLANRIARWNGSSWSVLGSGGGNGVDGTVNALAVSGSDLYVGGAFNLANVGGSPLLIVYRVARWNGSDWFALGSGLGRGVSAQVNALAVIGSDLFVGGDFTQANVDAPIAANRVAQWNGSTWSALGSGGGNGLNDGVLAMAVSGSNLYLGGVFTLANIGGAMVTTTRLASWNGSAFSAIGANGGEGLNDTVHALVATGSNLYAGGAFTQANVGAPITAYRVARWDGVEWTALGSGGGNGVDSTVRALALSDGNLYAGGDFTQANLLNSVPAIRIARWDGSAWSVLGSGIPGSVGSVLAIAPLDANTLYVGGSFSFAGDKISSNFALHATGADLQITKDNGRNGLILDETTIYAVVVTNAGPDAVVGATLIDPLPVTLTDGSWACIPAQSTGTCPNPNAGIGSLNTNFDLIAGQTLRFDVMARVDSNAVGSVVNTASVTLPVGVPALVPGNDSATDTDPILPIRIFANGFEGP